MRPTFALYLMAGAMFCTGLSAPADDAIPEVWMHHADALQLLDGDWDFVRENLDVVQFFIDRVNNYPQDRFSELVALLKENDIKLSIECGGTLDFMPIDETNGEASARHELAKMEKLATAGAEPDYLNLDGPIRRTMHPGPGKTGFESVQTAAEQLVIYMRKVRERFPRVQFFLLTNFPNWGWKGEPAYWGVGENRMFHGDYHEVLAAVVRETEAAGLPFLGLTVDNPLDFLMGEAPSPGLEDPKETDWMARVRELEDYARGFGLEFNLIVNSQVGGTESAERFAADTLEFVDAYRAAGGRPDRWIVESWYEHPEKVVPESEPATMTHLTGQVIRKVKPKP